MGLTECSLHRSYLEHTYENIAMRHASSTILLQWSQYNAAPRAVSKKAPIVLTRALSVHIWIVALAHVAAVFQEVTGSKSVLEVAPPAA
jgi:uncharacterized membrane protein YbaN (DUF454 family)